MNIIYVTQPCVLCGEKTELTIDADRLQLWREGALVQNVWPEWTPAERELLITGTHHECWDKLFGTQEEDE